MGFFNKLAFWKKEDDFSDLDFGAPKEGAGETPGGSMEQQAGAGFPTGDIGRQETAPAFTEPASQPESPAMPSALGDLGQHEAMKVQPVQPETGVDNYRISKEIEVISSKIDALRASIDSMNQRLANIEKMAQTEQESGKRRSW